MAVTMVFPELPPINLPGYSSIQLGYEGSFQLSLIVLVLVYVGLHILLASKFGRVVVSIRLNELRTELLGYDARLYKLIVFTIGAGIAGVAGILFANWGSFVGPTVFSILFSAQLIIWIMVGGLGTLIGAVVGAFAIQWLTTWLGTSKLVDPNIFLGAVFIMFVLLVPNGIQPKLLDVLRSLLTRHTN